jgi:2'-5' RNA ligase
LTTVTGLVFDLPHAPWIGDVMRLRAAYDSGRLRFPVEVTVVGSSGLGWFAEGIPRRELANKVQATAMAFSPFRFRFSGVTYFPGSTVYYLAPADAAPFHDFQRRLAASSLSFQPTPYSFTPHCTIAELSVDVASSARKELMAFEVPDYDILVESVSIYTLETEAQNCYQHERIALGV